MSRTVFKQVEFSVVICRHPQSGKYLAVSETKNRGWWLPAGGVDAGETFRDAAHRECLEEAGIAVRLMGVLRVEQTVWRNADARQRVIFFAEPADPEAELKSTPDAESNGAAWMSVAELRDRAALPRPDGLRGDELLTWGAYIDAGGPILPLSTFTHECDTVAGAQPFDMPFALLEGELRPLRAPAAEPQDGPLPGGPAAAGVASAMDGGKASADAAHAPAAAQ